MEIDESDEDHDGLIGYLGDYYHTDRLAADTDCDRQFAQSLPEERIDPVLLVKENAAVPSLKGTVAGAINENVEIAKAKVDNLEDNRSIVGEVIELHMNYKDAADLTLTFHMSQSSYLCTWKGKEDKFLSKK